MPRRIINNSNSKMAAFNKKRKLVSLNIFKPAFSLWLVFLLIFQIIAGVFLLLSPIEKTDAAGGGSWLSSWDKRIKVAVSNVNIDNDITQFPLLLTLGTSVGLGNTDVSAVFDELTSDGNRKKIAVTKDDGTSELYVEIEDWDDATETATLWVSKSDWTLSSSADTELYLYYDKDHADNTTYVDDVNTGNSHNVWETANKLTHHMEENPAGGATPDGSDEMFDSTSNNNDGNTGGTMTSGDQVAGQIDGSIDFDGSNDYVGVSDDPSIQVTIFTCEAWVKFDNLSKVSSIIDWAEVAGQSPGTSDGYSLITNGDGTIIFMGSGSADYFAITIPAADLSTGTWYHIVGTYDEQNARIYLNGVEKDSIAKTFTVVVATGFTRRIGGQVKPYFQSERYMDGQIDEVRIYNRALSADEIETNHYNGKDDLVSWGSEEVLPNIQFTQAVSKGAESLTPAQLELTLSVAFEEDITVDFAVTGGEATGSGEDYTLANGTATILAGSTTTVIDLIIIDDSINEIDETIIVTISNPTNATLGANTIHTYTIQDNDTAGVTVNPTSGLTTTEAGGEDTFTVVLNTQPAADVIIGLASSDTTEGTISPASLIFTSENWNAPQTVTVTGANDDIVDGDISYSIITAPASSTDGDYNGINPDDVSVINQDNDTEEQEYSSTDGKIYKNLKNKATSNGKVSYSKEPNPNDLINLKITPSFGEIEITIEVWNTSGDYYKKWKEDASSTDIISEHIVGDLKPSESYQVFVDEELFGTYASNSNGEISFTYNKGYSEKTFEIKEGEVLAETGKRAPLLYYLLSFLSAAIGVSFYSRTILKKNQKQI